MQSIASPLHFIHNIHMQNVLYGTEVLARVTRIVVLVCTCV